MVPSPLATLAICCAVGHALPGSVAQPPDDRYSEERAMMFLHFSNAAYCDAGSITNWTGSSCVKADPNFNATVFTDDDTQGQAYVGMPTVNSTKTASPAIVVGFRGSS